MHCTDRVPPVRRQPVPLVRAVHDGACLELRASSGPCLRPREGGREEEGVLEGPVRDQGILGVERVGDGIG